MLVNYLFSAELKRTNYGLAEGILFFGDPVSLNFPNLNESMSHLGCLLKCRFCLDRSGMRPDILHF